MTTDNGYINVFISQLHWALKSAQADGSLSIKEYLAPIHLAFLRGLVREMDANNDSQHLLTIPVEGKDNDA